MPQYITYVVAPSEDPLAPLKVLTVPLEDGSRVVIVPIPKGGAIIDSGTA